MLFAHLFDGLLLLGAAIALLIITLADHISHIFVVAFNELLEVYHLLGDFLHALLRIWGEICQRAQRLLDRADI